MKKNSLRVLSLIIAATLLLSLFAFADEGEEVRISSAKEFARFAKDCSLDSFSRGKTFVLTCDIDISKESYSPAPLFCGTFDGNGHTIKGFSYEENGSSTALFRRVSDTAVIKDLTVEGMARPGGTAKEIGGIAGTNAGRILNCTFRGVVKGVSCVGAVAGKNLASGIIADCKSTGTVFGEHYIGGICGENFGSIVSCENESSVNVTATEAKSSPENIDFKNLISTENTSDITDVGGIAGKSTGIVSSCVNRGNIGYRHVGYNIGGICGRQSGYLSACENTGLIRGRKDVGGICGQVEPYTVMKYSESKLDEVSGELDRLDMYLNGALGSADGMSAGISSELSGIGAAARGAKDNAKILKDKMQELLDTNIDDLNSSAVRITETINEISDALSNDALDELSKGLDDLEAAFEKISNVSDLSNYDRDMMSSSVQSAIKELREASRSLSYALRSFRTAINDPGKISEGTRELKAAIEDYAAASAKLSTELSKLSSTLGKAADELKNKNFSAAASYFAESGEILKRTGEYFAESAAALKNAGAAVEKVAAGIAGANGENILDGIKSLENTFDALNRAGEYISEAIDIFHENVDLSELSEVGDEFASAAERIKNGTDALSGAVKKIRDSLLKLGEEPIIEITKTDESFDEAADNFSNSIGDITDAFDRLNNVAKTGVDGIVNSLRGVSESISKICDILSDAAEDFESGSVSDEIDEIKTDISLEDTDSLTTGKIAKAKNTGEVQGDVNVGGICGLMAIEYDFDLEDDVTSEGKKTKSFSLLLRAVVRECENLGEVTGKKDRIGGICGKMSLGCAIDCINAGAVRSTSGDYVGGICGDSDTTIKNCVSRTVISGDDYIGGICGLASDIISCRSASYIEDGDENIGAVAGKVTGSVSDSRFLDYGVGAVDSVSYAGRAYPSSEQELCALPLGEVFEKFSATFKIDGKIVDTLYFKYGDTLAYSMLPEIPARAGCYAEWDAQFDNLNRNIITEAEYFPYITALESDMTRGDNLPILVCEGEFTSGDELKIRKNEPQKLGLFYRETEGYSVSCDKAMGKVHFLPEEDGQIFVFVKDGGEYRRVPSERDGRYIVFELQKGSTEFLAARHSKIYVAYITIVIILIVLGFAAVLLALCKLIGKRRSARKKNK